MRNQRGNFEQNINVIPNSNHDRIAAPYQILVSNPKRNIIIIATPVTCGIFYWEIRSGNNFITAASLMNPFPHTMETTNKRNGLCAMQSKL